MPLSVKLISADDHVQEPPDLWAKRLPKKLAEKGPRVAKQGAVERWLVEGEPVKDLPLARVGALQSDRYAEVKAWRNVPAAAYSPKERLKAMDKDGVHASALYPSAAGLGGEVLNSIKDPELEKACVEAYNDWLLDEWAKASPRFVPQCLVPISSVDAAVKELQRAVKKGHRGAVVPAAPWRLNTALPHLYDQAWDPFWDKACELGVPISFHSGSAPPLMLEIYKGFDAAIARGFDVVRRPSSSGMVVCRFLFSGIGERYPALKVVFSASGIDWVAFMLEVADHERERICRKGSLPYEMDSAPSEIFHRQCYVTTWFDKIGMRVRNLIGVENILWQSEFPLETSTYPKSQAMIEKNFEIVPPLEREKILSRNATKLYKLAP